MDRDSGIKKVEDDSGCFPPLPPPLRVFIRLNPPQNPPPLRPPPSIPSAQLASPPSPPLRPPSQGVNTVRKAGCDRALRHGVATARCPGLPWMMPYPTLLPLSQSRTRPESLCLFFAVPMSGICFPCCSLGYSLGVTNSRIIFCFFLQLHSHGMCYLGCTTPGVGKKRNSHLVPYHRALHCLHIPVDGNMLPCVSGHNANM
jgi:hypothetical protein